MNIKALLSPVNLCLGLAELGKKINTVKFKVNFAHTSTYKKSAVPYIQNMLNDHFRNKKLSDHHKK